MFTFSEQMICMWFALVIVACNCDQNVRYNFNMLEYLIGIQYENIKHARHTNNNEFWNTAFSYSKSQVNFGDDFGKVNVDSKQLLHNGVEFTVFGHPVSYE